MNINKYTEKAQEAVVGAQQLAERSGHPQIEPEHLLYTLLTQQGGIVPSLTAKMGKDAAALARDTQALLAKLPSAQGGAQPGLSPRLRAVTAAAEQEAEHLKDDYVSTEHLFVAIASETGRSTPAAKMLQQNGLTRDAIFQFLQFINKTDHFLQICFYFLSFCFVELKHGKPGQFIY